MQIRISQALISCLVAVFLTSCGNIDPVKPTLSSSVNPNRVLLPTNYTVYVMGKTALNHPAPGFRPKILPTYNVYTGYPGCYVVCYSHDAKNGIFPVNIHEKIYANGQVRVAGHYQGRLCQPSSYVQKNISNVAAFTSLCQKYISSCSNGNCWVGGDSGGWFGVQQ